MNIHSICTVLVLGFALPCFGQTGTFKINESSFSYLYNHYRTVQLTATPWAGTYWPYGENGLAWDWDGNGSPAEKWDDYWDQGHLATAWERQHHSCEAYRGTDYFEGCKGWWGHCNAWAAAALMEEEPRAEGQKKNSRGEDEEYFSTADKKALLTEVWMSSHALFAGNTNKSIETDTWVCNPNDPKSKATNRGVTNYDSFWDLSPRDFLLILTNYLGVQDKGVVIDRFTGDQVWNQPVVAYRILEVSEQDISKREVGGVTLHGLDLTLEIFWANDGVEPDMDTAAFDFDHLDEDSFEKRALKFTLFFDGAVQLNRGQIQKTGNLVGKGVWAHQDDCAPLEANEGHPDFVWRPTTLVAGGNANPHIDASRVYQVIAAAPPKRVPPGGEHKLESAGLSVGAGDRWLLTFTADSFGSVSNPKFIQRQVRQIFLRGLRMSHVNYSEIRTENRQVKVPVDFREKFDRTTITDLVEASGMSLEGAPVAEP